MRRPLYSKLTSCLVFSILSLNSIVNAQEINPQTTTNTNAPTPSSIAPTTVLPSQAAAPETSETSMGKALVSYKFKARINKNILIQFYKDNNYQLAWFDGNSLSKNANDLLEVIKASDIEGLSSQSYHFSDIQTLLGKIKEGQTSEPYQEQLDILLTDAFLGYARDIVEGRPELKRTDSQWLLLGRKIDVLAQIKTSLTQKTVKTDLENLAPKYRIYLALKESLPHYQALANSQADFKKIPSKLKLGDKGPNVVLLKKYLTNLNLLANDQAQTDVYDQQVASAIKKFQINHGLDDDGNVGSQTLAELNSSAKDRLAQIKINMERWRWLPETFGNHYLIVDLTGFEYFVVKDGSEVIRNKTVVGTTQRPTPVFTSQMKYIVFSPYWSVPYSIAIKDKLPRLKRNPYTFEGSGIRIYDRSNNEVDPGMIDWNNYNEKTFPYVLRQDPGVSNALGRVKFMFPNNHAIYLHDTPRKDLFAKQFRTFSSGCIRVDRPLDLAKYLLQDKNEWTDERIKAAYEKGKENTVHLTPEMAVQVYVLYLTAWLDEKNKIVFRPDIYNRDPAMIDGLNKLEQAK